MLLIGGSSAIGKTTRPPADRLRGHLDARCETRHADTPVYIWLRELRPLKPLIEPVAVVRIVDEDDPRNPLTLSEIIIMEQHWRAGHDLLNVRADWGMIHFAWCAYAQDGDIRGVRSLSCVPILRRRRGGPPLALGSLGRLYARQAIWMYGLLCLIRRYPQLVGRASVHTDLHLIVAAEKAKRQGRPVPQWVRRARRPHGHIPDPLYRAPGVEYQGTME